jgi:hypothetical protein
MNQLRRCDGSVIACQRVSGEAGNIRRMTAVRATPAAINFVPIARSVSCSPDVTTTPSPYRSSLGQSVTP